MKLRPLVLLLALVLLLHGSSLWWLNDQIRGPSSLKPMTEPMFTRIIEQSAPPALVATAALKATPKRPRPTKTTKSTPATTIQTVPDATAPAPADPAPDAAAPPAPQPPAAEPTTEPTVDTAIAPDLPASAPAPASAAPAPDGWPPDTRLSYRLTGNYHGELSGSARVQWQRERSAEPASSPARYQVRLAMSLTGVDVVTMTSQGQVTDAGLLPQVYEETLPGTQRGVTFDGGRIRFQNGRQAVQPPDVQDTASQFVELGRRFASGREVLTAGTVVRLWLARPGGMDEWTYDVLGPVTLQTPELGSVEAYHLKPRPLANPRGPIIAEMWFAPSLQHLPVRVRVGLGGDNFVDLMVQRIEQSAPAAPAVAPAPTVGSDPT